MAVKIEIEKPPVYGAVKGPKANTLFKADDPWTKAQKAAGGRQTIADPLGIGTNWIAYGNQKIGKDKDKPKTRTDLVNTITQPSGGGNNSRDNSGTTLASNTGDHWKAPSFQSTTNYGNAPSSGDHWKGNTNSNRVGVNSPNVFYNNDRWGGSHR